MKTVKILFCLLILLLIAVPVTAETSTISSISPKVGYTGSSTTVTITGTNFNESTVDVRLTMSDVTNITATVTSHTSTSIVCKFTLASTRTLGTWNLVVVNEDGSEVVDPDAFTLRAPMTLTSITPRKARTNNDSVEVTVVGTGLSDVSAMNLYNKNYGNITASGTDAVSTTRVTGIFDLTDANLDTYAVCVKDSFGTRKCDLSFEITSDAVGSIDVSSSPSGASLYLDGTVQGTTPLTIDDLDTGSYKLILKKDGYVDWMRTAKVTNGVTTSYDADLEVIRTATTTATPVPTTAPTTVRTTRKSTVTTPTPWPSDTPTQESPVGTLVIIGGIGIALLAIRRR